MTVFKNVLNDLKLNRISYLLEVIETQNFKQKVDAYNKLRKIKLNEDDGHFIIDKVTTIKHSNKDDFNVEISLLSLVFKNYYDSYSDHILEIFKKLNTNTKYELLNILANSNDPSELILYRILLTNYYKEFNNYPLGTIATNKDNYDLIFPELYETFKAKNNRNSILLLLNDFINQGVVPLEHLNKNKKVLQKLIINIFKEGIKYKIDTNENFMSKKEYIDLRIFLEVAINIEFYVSSKETKSNLDKLYKIKDNQLKLFILESYSRKEMSISKMNLNSIARDNLSRYPLYTFLEYNNLEKLMPKKYSNNKDLSLSDLYINYGISTGYTKVPYDFELLEERIIDNYKYYIYKFKAPFNYNEEIIDPATDYLLRNIKVDQELINNGEITYIGVSGGYNKDKNPSSIEKPLEGLKIAKLDDDLDKVINKLLNIEIKPVEVKKEEVVVPKEVKESKLSKIFDFSKLLTFFSIMIMVLTILLILYLNNIDLFNLRKNSLNHTNMIHAVLLEQKDLVSEINYKEIFWKEDGEYYVLFFKKKDKSIYYEYLNTLLKNDYKFYFVDLSNKDNKPIYEGNETGFVISEDTLLKVKDHEYSFYIIGKSNIQDEFKSYTDEIEKKLEEERKAKEKEAAKKKKKKNEPVDAEDILKELEKQENTEQPTEE
jgi:hypothetical protein